MTNVSLGNIDFYKYSQTMSYFHLIFGILFFIVFLITGQFMRGDFPDKEIISQELRLLMRSRHIYILFSALIHIILGLYLQMDKTAWRKVLQITGSILLFVSSGFLIWAFVAETYYARHFSDISRLGIYLSLGGIIGHLISKISLPKTR